MDTIPPQALHSNPTIQTFLFPSLSEPRIARAYLPANATLFLPRFCERERLVRFPVYISKQSPINFSHLQHALQQAGPYRDQSLEIGREWLILHLQENTMRLIGKKPAWTRALSRWKKESCSSLGAKSFL